MTRTETALQALAAVLVAPGVLPPLRRDVFFDDAMDQAGDRGSILILRRGRTQVLNRFMGAGDRFEISVGAEVEWAVRHKDETALNAAFDAGLEAVAAALAADPTLGGAVADCRLEEPPEYDTQEFDAQPCVSALLVVSLVLTSPQPF